MNSNRDFGSRSRRSRRGKRGRGALWAACAVALLAAASIVVLQRTRPPHASAPLAVTSPAPSPTPRPQPWTREQIARLRSALTSAFAPALAGARHWSLCVVAPDGRVLFDANARTGVVPASVEKLVVAFSALDLLGARFRYDTRLIAIHPPDTSGTLGGDLWLQGSGDPSLRSTDLAAATEALEREGVHRIAGGVLVDASAFRGPEINPYWNPDDADEDYQAPTSAISLDEDTVEFDVQGTTPGAAASVRMNPWSTELHAEDGITTVGAAQTPSVIVAALDTPNRFGLTGWIPAGALDREWVPVHDIAHYAGVVLTQILRERSIQVASGPGIGVVPQQATVLWEHRSASLRELLRHMLYFSDNHYAEQLMRTLGLLEENAGDDAHGLSVEALDLRRRGIPAPGMHLVDGSGLASANRLCALTMASLLARALGLQEERGFYDLLPQGGRSGTLKGYDFSSALGRVRAKTGHLTGVAALAGYVVSRRHGTVAFAFVIDGSTGNPDGAMVHAVDRISEF
ncbi:MAG TPA: D-alanyl-D-alanine carboxypeptidase/D-alanyl-D-alanine-endopeptidase [Candidatus Tyrphobacter sp.]